MKWLNRDLIAGPFLALAVNEREFHAVMRRLRLPKDEWPAWLKTPQSDATTHYFNNDKSGGLCAVVSLQVREGIEPLQIAALLVHEAVHVWQEFRDHIGERNPSSEFEAYSIQAIAQRLMYAYAETLA